jgi:PAS domain S-box-containing protein
MFEAMPTPAVIASPVTAKIIWVNSQLAEMYGAPADEIVGKTLFDFIESPQIGRAIADLARVVLGESPSPVTYQLKRADGRQAAGQISSVPLFFRGQPAMLSFVTDVSERERLLRSLRESEERYKCLLDSMPGGVVVVVDEYIAYANHALARALGFDSASELVDKQMFRFIRKDFRDRVREARVRMLLNGTSHPVAPVVLVRRDGSDVVTTAASTVVHWEGRAATQTLMYDIG